MFIERPLAMTLLGGKDQIIEGTYYTEIGGLVGALQGTLCSDPITGDHTDGLYTATLLEDSIPGLSKDPF